MMGFDKLKVLSFFHKVLYQDGLIGLYNRNYTIISEEGLFHNFGNEIVSLLNSGDEVSVKELMRNRAVVYCYSTPEIIAHQIIKRYNETGKLLPQHKTDSFETLIEFQKEALINKERFIETLKSFNIPVLMINTSDDIESNAKKVNAFISSLQKKN